MGDEKHYTLLPEFALHVILIDNHSQRNIHVFPSEVWNKQIEYLRGGRKRIKYGPCTKVYASTCPVSPSFAQLYKGRYSKLPSSKVTHGQCTVEFTFTPSCVHFASVLLLVALLLKHHHLHVVTKYTSAVQVSQTLSYSLSPQSMPSATKQKKTGRMWRMSEKGRALGQKVGQRRRAWGGRKRATL